MSRSRLAVTILAGALAACSGKRQTPPPATNAAEPAAAKLPPADDPREAALATIIRHELQERHLLQKTIDDATSEAALTGFLERLDPGKMFLLAADHEALASYARTIDDGLAAGRLDLAHDGATRFAARVAVVEPMVAGLLAAPLDVSDEESIETDGDKLKPVATEDELRARWRQRLELELLERTAAPLGDDADDDHGGATKDSKDSKKPGPTAPPLSLAERETKARTAMATAYAGRFARLRGYDVRDAETDLIDAIAGVLDPHTSYLPPAEKANFDIRISGAVEGIGALLREKDHYVEVQELVPGGAAWRQGKLNAGDIILAVAADGAEPVDVADMRIEEVVKMIRGPKGTLVHLKVRKAGGEEVTIDITRDVVVIESAYARAAILSAKDLPAIGYIYLPSFYGGAGRDAASDVRRLLAQLSERKVTGVILDLRGNGGGLLTDAVELAGLFIDQGPVVQVRGGDGETALLADEDAGISYGGPLVVLVDRFSASASEILAAALQDYHRAIIVGTGPTHGKGTVQSLDNLDRATGGRLELGTLKLTIQQYYRVNGWSPQLDGVTPDVVLPDPAAYVESRELTLPHAVPSSHIAAAPHVDAVATWNPLALAQLSAARVAKEPVFAQFDATTKLLLGRKGDTRIPLARPAFEARRKQQHDELKAVVPDLAKSPARLTVVPLDVTSATAPPTPPPPGARVDDRVTRWKDQLAHDPWLAEAARVLADATR